MLPIYLDYNATTPVAAEVAARYLEAVSSYFGNPSSVHAYGRGARAQVAEARSRIAGLFGVRSHEVIFTSCATEGLNTLIRSLKPGAHIITSSVEHAAVFEAIRDLETKGLLVTWLQPGEYGAVTKEQVLGAIRSSTAMIILMAVNNETGVKTDIDAIAKIAKEARIPFVVDGVAWLGKEKIVIPDGVSAICFSGHKIYAPKGVGFSIVKKAHPYTPLLVGGGQESGKRAGTENVPAILALETALRLIYSTLEKDIRHLFALRERFESALLDQIPDCVINGTGPRVCNTSNIAFLNSEGEALLMALDLAGIAVSHGSACSSGALEPSRVLLNMGLSRSRAEASIRFSFGRTTTEAEIDYTVQKLVEILRNMRK